MMNLNKELCFNKYGMDEEIYQQAIHVIEEVLKKIELLNTDKMEIEDNLSILGLIAESYPLLVNQSKWDEYTYKIMNYIKDKIQRGLFH